MSSQVWQHHAEGMFYYIGGQLQWSHLHHSTSGAPDVKVKLIQSELVKAGADSAGGGDGEVQ